MGLLLLLLSLPREGACVRQGVCSCSLLAQGCAHTLSKYLSGSADRLHARCCRHPVHGSESKSNARVTIQKKLRASVSGDLDAQTAPGESPAMVLSSRNCDRSVTRCQSLTPVPGHSGVQSCRSLRKQDCKVTKAMHASGLLRLRSKAALTGGGEGGDARVAVPAAHPQCG